MPVPDLEKTLVEEKKKTFDGANKRLVVGVWEDNV